MLNLSLSDNSGKFLILSNLISLCFAIIFGFDLGSLMWLYLLESILIGFFTFLSLPIIAFRTRNLFAIGLSVFLSFFFLFHYGGFHFVYLIFLSVLPYFKIKIPLFEFFLSLLPLFLSHAYSFFEHVLFSNDPADSQLDIGSVASKFIAPYSRILPMHLTIIFSGFLVVFVGPGELATKLILIVFMVLKIVADLHFHNVKHGLKFTTLNFD
ncbi:hypothetical protein HY990_00490 [Candidatus Micrarchaeota archaeon]|nr:hypothetical protein [Candidatus Micrarchaeota archaeon]